MAVTRRNDFRRPTSRAGWPGALLLLVSVTATPAALCAQPSRQFADERIRPRQSAVQPGRSSLPQKAATPRSRFSDARPITPSSADRNSANSTKPVSRTGPSIWKTFGVLSLIVAVIVVVGRMWKKHGPKLTGGLPAEVIDIIGKRNIDARQSIYLVRLGSRILVLGSTANGLQTLAEVNDPVEVDYLAGLSRQSDADNGVAQSFRTLFSGQNVLQSEQQGAVASPQQPAAEPQATEAAAVAREFLAAGRPHV